VSGLPSAPPQMPISMAAGSRDGSRRSYAPLTPQSSFRLRRSGRLRYPVWVRAAASQPAPKSRFPAHPSARPPDRRFQSPNSRCTGVGSGTGGGGDGVAGGVGAGAGVAGGLSAGALGALGADADAGEGREARFGSFSRAGRSRPRRLESPSLPALGHPGRGTPPDSRSRLEAAPAPHRRSSLLRWVLRCAPSGAFGAGAGATVASPTSGGGGAGSGPRNTAGRVATTATATATPAASLATFAHLTRRPRMPLRSPGGDPSPPAVRPSLKLRPLWRESTNWC
jgi:hypothetical protein